jgi:ABC-type uncharacterized transport system substrate-binding protein
MANENKHKCCWGKLLTLLVVTGAVACVYWFWGGQPSPTAAVGTRSESPAAEIPEQLVPRQYKVLHVMSYHSPWQWTDAQLKGFEVAMEGLPVEYKVMQMDTKRKSDEAWKQLITARICTVIDQWKPDLVYTSDDNAQAYVTDRYLNSKIPFVFSGVNEDPQTYGFTGVKNVTGVLERMHYAATMKLLKKLVPSVKKVAVITDAGVMWPPMIERMKKQSDRFDGIEVVSYDIIDTFDHFKQKVREYQDTVDAFGLLGIFEFKDENGNNATQEQVLDWVWQNSKLPDFSFYEDRVARGTLCAVTVSAYDQGYQAGLLARKILVYGVSPSDLPMVPTEKGIPVVNLECARRLNITPSADVLLTARVMRNVLKD